VDEHTESRAGAAELLDSIAFDLVRAGSDEQAHSTAATATASQRPKYRFIDQSP
jgi:hypothetical protein